MFHVQRVAAPVDFSRSSRAAVRLALSLGEPAPQLAPIHVIDRWPEHLRAVIYPWAGLGADEPAFEHAMREASRDALAAWLAEVGAPSEPAPRIEVGPIHATLSAALGATDADIIAVGAHGASGARPDRIGSTAAGVLRSRPGPLLIARAGHGERRPQRIMVALDLGPTSPGVLDVALGLAIQCEAHFEAIFVLPDPFAGDDHGLWRAHLKADAEAVLERERPKIKALFERAWGGLSIPYPLANRAANLWRERRAIAGDPADALIERVERTGTDLLVFGARDTSEAAPALGRVAAALLRRAPCHLLAVPPRDSSVEPESTG